MNFLHSNIGFVASRQQGKFRVVSLQETKAVALTNIINCDVSCTTQPGSSGPAWPCSAAVSSFTSKFWLIVTASKLEVRKAVLQLFYQKERQNTSTRNCNSDNLTRADSWLF